MVTETPADSTEDSLGTASTEVAEADSGSGRKRLSHRKNKDVLLTRLLSASHSSSDPPTMLDPETINAIATGTPQMNLVRRPVSGELEGSAPGENNSSTDRSSGSAEGAHPDPSSSLLGGDSLHLFESDDDLTSMICNMGSSDVGMSGEDSAFLSHLEKILSSPSIVLSDIDILMDDPLLSSTTTSSSKDSPKKDLLESVAESKENSTAQTEQPPPAKVAKRSGTGLLQQLLGGNEENAGNKGESCYVERFNS